MIDHIVEISKDALLGYVQKMLYDGYRFITITCVDNGNGTFDLIYHFDKNLKMKNARVTVEKNDEVLSISKIFFSAILVENEIKELFGIPIKNIAIDYGGRMLLSDEELESPMARQITVIQKGDIA